jgi:hypothetical protein
MPYKVSKFNILRKKRTSWLLAFRFLLLAFYFPLLHSLNKKKLIFLCLRQCGDTHNCSREKLSVLNQLFICYFCKPTVFQTTAILEQSADFYCTIFFREIHS